MAIIKTNAALGDLSGRIGDLVFVKLKSGKTIVRKRPERKAPPRKGELANQKDFTHAVAYAKGVWATNPDLREKYEATAKLNDRQGFQVAKSDFRRPPEIRDIELSDYSGSPGDVLRIAAVDDFEVKSVRVVIRSLAGNVIEQGTAASDDGNWIYAAQTQIPSGQTVVVEVTATDHPGHSATKKVDHACGPRA